MNSDQPCLEVGEDEVDHRQVFLGDGRIVAFRNGQMVIAARGEAGVAAPVVGDDQRLRSDSILDEAAQGRCTAILDDGKAKAARVATTVPLVQCRSWLALADFDGGGHQHLVVDTTSFAARPSADIGLIHLDVDFWQSADPVAVGTHHASAELVQDAEGCFVTGQSKLPLELDCRHSRCLACDEVSRPEPDAERDMAPLHHSANR